MKENGFCQAKLSPNYELFIEKSQKIMNSRCKILSEAKLNAEREKILEIEIFCKENIKEISHNLNEIREICIKFEENQKYLKDIIQITAKNEINYKMIIKLCHLRLLRVNNNMDNCSNDSLIQEILNLKEENFRLHETLAQSENINLMNITKKGKYQKSQFFMLLNDNKSLLESLDKKLEKTNNLQINKMESFPSQISNETMKMEFKQKLENLNQENIMYFIIVDLYHHSF